jgi:menaquinone-dependent protoporphyrinogen oxidase
MRVIVVTASKHGSTTDVGRRIAARLREHGLDVDEPSPGEACVAGADAVVVGSAVYAGRWLAAARAFVRANMAELRRLPVFAFSSGPVGDPPRPAGEPHEGSELAELVHARDHRVIVGRIDTAQLGLAERAVVRLLGASTEDDRDWASIDAYADEIASVLGAAAAV